MDSTCGLCVLEYHVAGKWGRLLKQGREQGREMETLCNFKVDFDVEMSSDYLNGTFLGMVNDNR